MEKNYSPTEPKEFYNLTDTYAVTISPDDSLQCWSSTTNRMINFRKRISTLFVGCANDKTRYRFYIEISQNGRLHLHGYISFNDNHQILNHYLYTIPLWKKQCQVKIDKITNKVYWKNYIMKQQHIIKQPPITNYYTIPKDVLEVSSRTDVSGAHRREEGCFLISAEEDEVDSPVCSTNSTSSDGIFKLNIN